MKLDRPALGKIVREMNQSERTRLGEDGLNSILELGKQWNLAQSLRTGGSVIFPHAGLESCGHQIAAAVHACLDSEADQVLAIGVLHALTDELEDARVKVAAGADPGSEDSWGIQGPGLAGRDDWKTEYSLSNFELLLNHEALRRGVKAPAVFFCYPYLAGGKPETLPRFSEVKAISRDAVIVSTADPFHHGIGYGDTPETALAPQAGGLDVARKRIEEGLNILGSGDYWGYNEHCVAAKSDARDAGQVLRSLLGPFNGRILDLTYQNTTDMYSAPPPTWVANALIELNNSKE